jgi:hypothetical protein
MCDSRHICTNCHDVSSCCNIAFISPEESIPRIRPYKSAISAACDLLLREGKVFQHAMIRPLTRLLPVSYLRKFSCRYNTNSSRINQRSKIRRSHD